MIEYRRRSYEELREVASSFLAKHHPSGTLPIPIEEIVDFQLGLNIAPIPGLQEFCKDAQANAFLSRDLSTIFVDQYICEEAENRYRFTLAYEVGRLILQSELVASCDVDGLEAFLDWHASFSDDAWEKAKFECYDFAGLLLIPTRQLIREVRRVVDDVEVQFEAHGVDVAGCQTKVWSRVAAHLASKVFKVSDTAMRKRLRRERLLPPNVHI